MPVTAIFSFPLRNLNKIYDRDACCQMKNASQSKNDNIKLLSNQDTNDAMSSKFIHRRKVGILEFVSYAFFLSAGGPFGLETCIQYGGPFLTIIGLIIIPFIYELPQAFMTSELSTMIPCNGGYIIWIFRAWCPLLGWIASYNNMLCNLFDNAIYPTLILTYYHILYPNNITGIVELFLKEFVVFLGLVINLFDAKKIGNLNTIFTIIVLFPFILGFILCLPNILNCNIKIIYGFGVLLIQMALMINYQSYV